MRPTNRPLQIFILAAVIAFIGASADCLTIDEFLGSFPPLSIELSYGPYQGTATNVSTSGSSSSNFDAPAPTLGIGFNLKLPASDSMKYFSDKSWWELGFTSNMPTSDLAISYASINFMGAGDMFYGGIGLNISFWNQGISGGAGAQFKTGVTFSDNFTGGIKFIYLSGTKSTPGYNNYYKIYNLMLDFNFQI